MMPWQTNTICAQNIKLVLVVVPFRGIKLCNIKRENAPNNFARAQLNS